MSEEQPKDSSDGNKESKAESGVQKEEKDEQGSEIVNSEEQPENITEEAEPASTMLLNDRYISPERRVQHIIGNATKTSGSVAETYVTQSIMEKYGPIVSPTISPTKQLDSKESGSSRVVSPSKAVYTKSDRDYEAAAFICSIRDSVKGVATGMHDLTSSSMDTIRVSRISTLLDCAPTIMQEYSSAGKTNGQHQPRDQRLEYADYDMNLKPQNRHMENGYEYSSKRDSSYTTSNSSNHDDTEESDNENEDYSMIIRPRDPDGHDNGDSAVYNCRLPCCTRMEYTAHNSQENNRHYLIRVPGRRPQLYREEPCQHSNTEKEQFASFDRYRDSNKSAFSTVSPTRKRPDQEFPTSNVPAIKVRVITENNLHADNQLNGDNKVFNNEYGPCADQAYKEIGYAVVKTEPDMELSTRSTDGNVDIKSFSSLIPQSTQGYQNSPTGYMSRSVSGFMNGHLSNYSTSSPSNFGIIKPGGTTSSGQTVLVQCSTVDSTASENAEGESRLLDLARVANEQLGEEIAKQQPMKKGKPKSNDCLHLWEFLRDILNNETMVPRAIEWTVKERGEFRLIKTGVVAQLWGLSKNRTSMTYEKMARAMRYYYKMKILEKVPHKRLHFRFGKHMLPKVLVSKE